MNHGTGDERDLPRHRALFVIDMQGYSKVDDRRMGAMRNDLDEVLTAVFAQSGLHTEWENPEYRSDTGDGVILVLETAKMWRLIDPLIDNLDRALCRYDRARLASAPAIRVRVSVHLGPLSDSYRGSAINDLCRLISSDAAYRAIRVADAQGAFVALIVSEGVFENVVRGGRAERLGERNFRQVIAAVPGKGFSTSAWIHVPGVSPSALAECGLSPALEAEAPSKGTAAIDTAPAAAPKYSIGTVGQFAENVTAPVHIHQIISGEGMP